jgi:hypothetical protein
MSAAAADQDDYLRSLQGDLINAVEIALKPYYTVVWCPDCNGIDFQGCFDGDVERLGPFSTRDEADRAGRDLTTGSIWRYDVEDRNAGS